jgi:hypothetical protein
MEQQEETFQITVQINKGLEPTTFMVIAENSTSTDNSKEIVFKISRQKDKEPIAVLSPDSDHHWQQVKGDFNEEEIDAIGAAIKAH